MVHNKRILASYIGAIKLLLALVLVFASTLSKAIVMRHDVHPDEYLLDIFSYQSTIVINGCTATLVAPKWVLTAAHCTFPNLHDGISVGSEVHLMDETIAVKSIYNHPEFSQGETPTHDIALVELVEPSYSVLPTPIYEQNGELGSILKLAGYGVVGDGERDIYDHCFPCRLRGADNKVEVADNFHLKFRFDHPEGGNSLALEGVGAGGDSGGPAYLETDAGRFVAGVSSFGSREYNGFDHYVRVSQQLSWIYEVMGQDYVGQYAGPLYSEQVHEEQLQEKEQSNSGGASGTLLLMCLLVCSRNVLVYFVKD